VRKLGIPTVLDRLVQQAILQVLQSRWDPTFSEHSYGFRPGRSAHQAVAQAQSYVAEGHEFVVDIDLEKFWLMSGSWWRDTLPSSSGGL
jgi:RNA-directed DNA polymerase